MIYSELYKFGNNKNDLSVVIEKLYEDRDGGEHVSIRVEKLANAESFAEFRLPEHRCYKSYDFSEQDLFEIDDYLLHNEALIWELAREQEAERNAASA